MKKNLIALLAAAALTMGMAAPAFSQQCVPYARANSGVSLRGDAWTWWASANGIYDKGQTPREGAVMVFKKHGSMRHGHVAVVTKLVNKRTVLVDHANWAPRRGAGRGKVAEDVAVMDVSPKNDWSQLRVWYRPVNDFGTKVYPAYGFIYPKASGKGGLMQASYTPADDAFAAANGNFDPFSEDDDSAAPQQEAKAAPEAVQAEPAKSEPAKSEPVTVEAAKAEPAKVEVAKVEPAKAEPAKAEPAKTEAVKAEPVKAEAPKADAPVAEVKLAAVAPAPAAPAPAPAPVAKTETAAPAKAEAKQSKPAAKAKQVKMDAAVPVEAPTAAAAAPAKAEQANELWEEDALAAKLAGAGSYASRRSGS